MPFKSGACAKQSREQQSPKNDTRIDRRFICKIRAKRIIASASACGRSLLRFPTVGLQRRPDVRLLIAVLAKAVWGALRSMQHRVCLVIVVEAFLNRVPSQLAVQLHSNVMKQAGGTGAVSCLYGGNRLLPRADALQPVAVLVVALIQMDSIGANLAVQNARITGQQRGELPAAARIAGRHLAVTRNKDPAVAAVEFDPVRKIS